MSQGASGAPVRRFSKSCRLVSRCKERSVGPILVCLLMVLQLLEDLLLVGCLGRVPALRGLQKPPRQGVLAADPVGPADRADLLGTAGSADLMEALARSLLAYLLGRLTGRLVVHWMGLLPRSSLLLALELGPLSEAVLHSAIHRQQAQGMSWMPRGAMFLLVTD